MSLRAGNWCLQTPMDIKSIQIQHIEFATKWAKRTIERGSTRIAFRSISIISPEYDNPRIDPIMNRAGPLGNLNS